MAVRAAILASVLALASACSSPPEAPREGARAPSASLFEGVVDASCAGCRLGVASDDCELAVRIDGRVLLVDGTGIDDHGDAHAADGFCNAIRRARVRGRVAGDRFVAESFELLPAGAR